jgi:hypothetical protein
VRSADQCGSCADEHERVRRAEQLAAEAAKAPKPLTPEQIAVRAERRRQAERQEAVNSRFWSFWEKLPKDMRLKLNRMSPNPNKPGTSFRGETVEEQEAVLDSLENGTHPVFRPAPAVTTPIVEDW